MPSPDTPGNPLPRLLATAILAAAAVLSLLPLRAPFVPASLLSEAAVERAAKDQAAISRRPHPIGSAEHRRVRRQLLRSIEAAGLRPRVQAETVVVEVRPGVVRAGRVHNVMARLPGTASTGAVLLAAHYDTVPGSPGASDNGAAVAALLETMRLFAAAPAPRNDVVFLFTDGEEVGLLGARAFLRHPWSGDIGLVLNFDARGSEGPSMMFETAPGTGALVADFAEVAPRPVAASYSADVYRFLPNETDFSMLDDLGAPGFNFAFIEGASSYHSSRDVTTRASRASLRHHLGNAWTVARHFAAEDLRALPAGQPSVHFVLPLAGLVSYSMGTSRLLAVVAALLMASALAWALRRKLVRPAALSWALGACLLAVVASGAAALVLRDPLAAVVGLHPRMLSDAIPYLASWAVLGAAVAALVLLPLQRRLGFGNLIAGAALLWTLLTVAGGMLLPGSSFLLLWPCLGLSAILVVLSGDAADSGVWRGLGVALLTVPLLLLWVPTLYLVSVALGFGASVPLAVAGALLVLGMLPALSLVVGRGRARWWAPATILAAALAGLLVLGARAGYGAHNPRPDTLLYLVDGDRGEAYWATLPGRTDAWLSQFFSADAEVVTVEGFFADPQELLLAPAPPPALPLPEIEVVDPALPGDGPEAGEAADGIVLRFRSHRDAESLRIFIHPRRPSTSLRIAGQELQAAQDGSPWDVVFYAPPEAGVSLALSGPDGASSADRAIVVDRLWGLPPTPSRPWTERPPEVTADPFTTTDVSLIKVARQL